MRLITCRKKEREREREKTNKILSRWAMHVKWVMMPFFVEGLVLWMCLGKWILFVCLQLCVLSLPSHRVSLSQKSWVEVPPGLKPPMFLAGGKRQHPCSSPRCWASGTKQILVVKWVSPSFPEPKRIEVHRNFAGETKTWWFRKRTLES